MRPIQITIIYYIMSSSLPFIIRTKYIEPTVPVNSALYDESQETRIQVLQAINGYLTINMLVESCKIFWAFWHYEQECPAFSYLSLGFMGINIIWALCSYYGFKSIRSKNSRNIQIFGYTVLLNLILRVAMYSISGVIMQGKVPNYASITTEQLNNLICTALYPKGLYIVTGIVEGLLCLLILFMLRSVVQYVKEWQSSETAKYLPTRKIPKEDNEY